MGESRQAMDAPARDRAAAALLSIGVPARLAAFLLGVSKSTLLGGRRSDAREARRRWLEGHPELAGMPSRKQADAELAAAVALGAAVIAAAVGLPEDRVAEVLAEVERTGMLPPPNAGARRYGRIPPHVLDEAVRELAGRDHAACRAFAERRGVPLSSLKSALEGRGVPLCEAESRRRLRGDVEAVDRLMDGGMEMANACRDLGLGYARIAQAISRRDRKVAALLKIGRSLDDACRAVGADPHRMPRRMAGPRGRGKRRPRG